MMTFWIVFLLVITLPFWGWLALDALIYIVGCWVLLGIAIREAVLWCWVRVRRLWQ